MAVTAEHIELGPDEFAFYFETEAGVDATALANFLKRAATVAKQWGGDLQVVGLHQGSLAVVLKVIKRSKVGQDAAKEFSEKPIDTTVKIFGFIGAIVSAIIYAMTPLQNGSTPLAKAGAEVIEKHRVTQISIVTNTTNTVIMNQLTASQIRTSERNYYPKLPAAEPNARLSPPVALMIEEAQQGNLSGDAALVGRELHFRPDGYRYWVPTEVHLAGAKDQLFPGGRFRVLGRIATRNGQPDRIVIERAEHIK